MKKGIHKSIRTLILAVMLAFCVGGGGIALHAAGSFAINLTQATINIGDDNRLELEIEGLTAEDNVRPMWNSWNENVAKVAQEGEKGIVTAVNKGKAIISSGIGFPRQICMVTVVEPSIKLNKTAATLYCGSEPADSHSTSIQLKASVKGANKDIEWRSSNEAVATVDAMGKVQPVAEGRATITAKANGKTSSCTISVFGNKLSLNIGAMKLSTKGVGSSVKLLPTVIGANKRIVWESDNTAVAVVKGGKVTGKSAGNAKITATANGVKAECAVTVIDGLLSINEEHAVLYVTHTGADERKAENIQLKTNAAKGTALTWNSSNKAVATVEDGRVTAVSAGTAVISVQTGENPETMDTCTVEVKETETLIGEKVVHLKTKGTARTHVLDYEVIGRKNAVKWKSSNTKVVSISKGKLTAKKPGTAVITAVANDVQDTVTVTVDEFKPTITLKQNEYTLYTKGKSKDSSVALKAVIDGPKKKAAWSSSNEEVAKVAANGKVTAVGEGRAVITATANGVAAKCWIQVKNTAVTLEKNYYVLKTGEQAVIDVNIVGASQTAKFKAKDAKVVKVDNKGNITGKKEGRTEIVVTANGVPESCYVYVTDCEHEWGAVPEEKADKNDVRIVSCEKGGLTTKYCAKCEAKMQDVQQPLGHDFGRWIMEVKATESSVGLEKQVCSRCGVENTRTIPAKSTAGNAGSYGKGDLVWADEFDTPDLNLNDWNFEYHEPGWVNAELQEYVDSRENTYIENGMLHIRAIKEMRDGKPYYTAGRINTQGKHTFQYGRFEVRAKVPSGKGFLPAFWMMPENESYYGQWPKCGEIDIMEVHGSALDTSYSTLHFGDPHTQKQGSYTLPEGADDFNKEFHVFACEWDPGEFRFYVDDVLTYTVNDWFTKKDGFDKVAYPAPYDQPFYMILNLAVGGSWVGYPEDDDVFEDNAHFIIDYVRVYQKDHYDMDVDRPESIVQLRDPDESGNYIINGDFSKNEDLSNEDSNWRLLFAEGGEATAEISDNTLHIKSTNAGTVNYGVQLVQAGLPMENGAKYKLSYDAWADEARTMITDISAPDRGYIRYLEDKTDELTTDRKRYEHVFDMTGDSDANGRVEFNLGNQGSLATVHIADVRLEKEGSATEEEKGMRPDGNYVYNGSFDEGNEPGKLRLAYWDWDWDVVAGKGTKVSVTNDSIRELEVTVPDTVTALDQVTLYQSPIAISGGKKYSFSLDARAKDKAKTIKAELAGNTYDIALTTEMQTFKYEFDAPADLNGTKLRFLLGTPGTVYIDNVAVREDALIVNGDFSSGMLGYEVYVNDAAKVPAYVVDSLNEKDAFSIDIADTGNQDWYIQLKQNSIKLEKDKWYKLSLDAKSTVDREIMFALQRDGTSDDNWTPYSGQPKAALTSEFQKFEKVFHMDYDTDPKTVLSISLGAVGGKQISNKHTVVIDNIMLEETEAQEEPPAPPVEPGKNLIKNGDFANGETDWNPYIHAGTEEAPGAVAEKEFKDNKAVFKITNVGTDEWHVQLKQSNLKLEKDAEYLFNMKIKSTEARTVKYVFQDPTDNKYLRYGGQDLVLEAGVEKAVEYPFTVDQVTSDKIDFQISMGQMKKWLEDGTTEDIPTTPSTIEISEISLVKTSGGENPDNPDEPIAIGTELIKNGSFADGEANWEDATASPGAAKVSFTGGKAVYEISNVGTEDYHVQLKQSGLKLEKGSTYQVSLKIKSTAARTVKVSLLDPENGYAWYGGKDITLNADKQKSIVKIVKVGDDKATSETIAFQISMGKIADEETPVSTIEIADISVKKVSNDVTESSDKDEEITDTPDDQDKPIAIGTELIKNGGFADGEANWEDATASPGAAKVSFTGGKAVYEISNVGTEDYHVQLKQSGLKLEKGSTYQVSLKIKSTAARTVKVSLLDPENGYAWYGGKDITLNADKQKSIVKIVKVGDDKATSATIAFQISMGKMADEETPASTIEISDISVKKVSNDVTESSDKDEEIPDTPDTPDDPDEPIAIGTELIKNGSFADGKANWEDATASPGVATASFTGGKAVYEISNVGTEDHHVQLKQSGLKLEKGSTYQVSLKIKSTAARTVKVSLLDPENSYAWYGGKDIELNADKQKSIVKIVKVGDDKATSETIAFQISMGKITDKETPASTIEITDISVKKVSNDVTEDSDKDEEITDEPIAIGTELIKNGSFADGEANWEDATASPGAAKVSFTGSRAVYEISNVGEEDHHVQLKQSGLKLEKASTYQVSLKIKSTAARTVKVSLLDPENGYAWYGGKDITLNANKQKSIVKIVKVGDDKATSGTIAFQISMGQIYEGEGESKKEVDTPTSTIEITDISVKKVSNDVTEDSDKDEEVTDDSEEVKGNEEESASEKDAESGSEEQIVTEQQTESSEITETEETEVAETEESETTETEESTETETSETSESET